MGRYIRGLLWAIPFLCLCSLFERVSINEKTSACMGFKELSKMSAKTYTQDTLDYCEAEKVRWSYSSSSGVLTLLHTRQLANCAAELKMLVSYKNGVYKIEERDERDPNTVADCECYFDTYCEVEDVTAATITISYAGIQYSIDLSKSQGVVEISNKREGPCMVF